MVLDIFREFFPDGGGIVGAVPLHWSLGHSAVALERQLLVRGGGLRLLLVFPD